MTKTFIALAAAATLATGTLATPNAANAQCFGCRVGAGVAAGLLVGAAIANAATPQYGVVYTNGFPYPRHRCFWTTQKVWTGFGWTYDQVWVCA